MTTGAVTLVVAGGTAQAVVPNAANIIAALAAWNFDM
jgi:hypothetical protein